MDEQMLFGLMAIAQEHQKAVDTACAKLASRQAELDALVVRASKATQSLELASKTVTEAIEKAARSASLQAVREALEPIGEQARVRLAKAIDPASEALTKATQQVVDTDRRLNKIKNSLSWKFSAILGLVCCMLLATMLGLAHFFVPSLQEIADLKSAVADLERRGGKVQLNTCGDNGKRLCAKIDVGANDSKGGWGKNGEWMILQGY